MVLDRPQRRGQVWLARLSPALLLSALVILGCVTTSLRAVVADEPGIGAALARELGGAFHASSMSASFELASASGETARLDLYRDGRRVAMRIRGPSGWDTVALVGGSCSALVRRHSKSKAPEVVRTAGFDLLRRGWGELRDAASYVGNLTGRSVSIDDDWGGYIAWSLNESAGSWDCVVMKTEVAVGGDLPWYLADLAQARAGDVHVTADRVQFAGPIIETATIDRATGLPISIHLRPSLPSGSVLWLRTLERMQVSVEEGEWQRTFDDQTAGACDSIGVGFAAEAHGLLLRQFLASSRTTLRSLSYEESEILGEAILHSLVLGTWMREAHQRLVDWIRTQRGAEEIRLKDMGLGGDTLAQAVSDWESASRRALSRDLAGRIEREVTAIGRDLEEGLRARKELDAARAVGALVVGIQVARELVADRYMALRFAEAAVR